MRNNDASHATRLRSMLSFDQHARDCGSPPDDFGTVQLRLFSSSYNNLIGVDEVGRGCLAGPVMAAAVCLDVRAYDLDTLLMKLNDSKQMTARQRQELAIVIRQVARFGVGFVSHEEIDSINILNASMLAMTRAVDQLLEAFSLDTDGTLVLVDGKRALAGLAVNQCPVPFGDQKSASIAAASVLAKVARDGLMGELARSYPGYEWEKNKGYPSKAHKLGLRQLGPSPLHRVSFALGQ